MRLYIITDNRLRSAKIAFDSKVIAIKPVMEQNKEIYVCDIRDYTTLCYSFYKVVCIRYTARGLADTCCITGRNVSDVIEMLENSGIRKGTPESMQIAVPEDGGEKLSKLSKTGMALALVLFVTFLPGAAVSNALFGGAVGMVTTVIHMISYMICGGLLGNATWFWSLKNGVEFGKPLNYAKCQVIDVKNNETTDAKGSSKAIINAIIAVLCLVELVCMLLFFTFALGNSTDKFSIFAVWAVGALSAGGIILLTKMKKNKLK